MISQGTINPTALIVPGLYVNILPPSAVLINGVPTNVMGIVGIASWGPVNVPVSVGGMQQFDLNFGPILNLTHDLGTAAAVATLQGANNFALVRVTDGTDVKATAVLDDTLSAVGVTLTARYSGTVGNTLQAIVASGSALNTFKVTLTRPNYPPEIFDNIGGTGATLWQNIAGAINNGNSAFRGPSTIATAVVGVSTATPALATVSFTAGTNGTTTVTDTTLVGVDAAPRTGMFALRKQNASVAMLADAISPITYSEQAVLGGQEGIYFIGVGAAGETVASAVTNKIAGAVANYCFKLLVGDWLYWYDPVNLVTRLVSPQAFAAGLLVAMLPNMALLNQELYGIIGSQSSIAGTPYSDTDMQTLVQNQMDVIAFPSIGGDYWSCATGLNTDTNAVVNGDEYTRMTNYIAVTMNKNMGQFVGNPQTLKNWGKIRGSMKAWLYSLQQADLIGPPPGAINNPPPPAFSVQIDGNNNPPTQTTLGLLQANVKVTYLSIIREFLINVEGGANVTITPGQPQIA